MKTLESLKDYIDLVNQDKLVLLDFYADWCESCQTLMPIIEKLSKEYEGKVEIQKVNIDKNNELASQFRVRSIPSLIFIKNLEILKKINGLASERELRDVLELLLNKQQFTV